jgi:hypothetical protein
MVNLPNSQTFRLVRGKIPSKKLFGLIKPNKRKRYDIVLGKRKLWTGWTKKEGTTQVRALNKAQRQKMRDFRAGKKIIE